MKRLTIPEAQGQDFDLIVIGGGITGASTAREAALRGLSVLLVEKNDLASGTSSKSSNLVHGGLRYLQTYQFHMVAESLRERENLVKTAPHLVKMRPFLYLVYEGDDYGKGMLNLGLTFYDVVSGEWRKRRHSMLSKDEVLKLEPHISQEGSSVRGKYYDALTDDARLTIDTAKSAYEYGAQLINHAEVTDLILESGRARGVQVTDTITGESAEIRGRQVMGAVGPWTDRVRQFEHSTQKGPGLRPSKGIHIVVKKSDFPLNNAIFLTSPDDGRTVWPIPSLEEDLVYIGTTDTDYTGDLNHVVPEPEEIQYLLNVANNAIRFGVPEGIAASWVNRYGSNAAKILSIWQAEEGSRQTLGTRSLSPAEVRYCVREEMCATLEDLLVRRKSLFFWDESGGLDSIDRIADELSKELGWDSERRTREIENYRASVAEHRR